MQRFFQQALRPTLRATGSLQVRAFQSSAARLADDAAASGKATQVSLSFQTPSASIMSNQAVDLVIVPGVEGNNQKGSNLMPDRLESFPFSLVSKR